ncbi:SDR family NAD(P)-dependent oxidoreductase [Naasia sp. SYSU D00948]|uniref:SDR family NAD(P)-dependent oxidoreductase n=1 Tax=Naasia sp. SYSU D00948 TaxID=2817379 RepID=UPI001B30F9C7|nr:SDR family oxidoreductase [Naasia sp. SYSU D00948]
MTAVDPAGRVALVTGGGTGIGRAVCERLAGGVAGGIVIAFSRSGGEATQLAARLSSQGVRAVARQADVSDRKQVEDLISAVEAEFGRLDYLVNNAGRTRLIPFADLDAATEEIWTEILGTNLMGTFWCSRAAAALLRRSRGAIVNIASISGTRAVGSSLPYGVSKAAVLQLTRSLAAALAPDVRVNSVSAGTVRSGWHEKLIGDEAFAEKSEREAAVVPLQRLAAPADIAEAVVAMLTTSFVTGQDLLVDGGKGLLY